MVKLLRAATGPTRKEKKALVRKLDRLLEECQTGRESLLPLDKPFSEARDLLRTLVQLRTDVRRKTRGMDEDSCNRYLEAFCGAAA